jgi:hypothetical protein
MKINMGYWWNITDRGKPNYSEKTLSPATLPTTNLTWTVLGSKPGFRGEGQANNRLNRGTVHVL